MNYEPLDTGTFALKRGHCKSQFARFRDAAISGVNLLGDPQRKARIRSFAHWLGKVAIYVLTWFLNASRL